MKKAVKWIIAAVVLLVILAFSGMFYTVREDEHALVTRFSKVIQIESDSGVHFKLPFIDEVVYYPKAAQLYDNADVRIIRTKT